MKWIRLAIAILICQAAGIVGSVFTFTGITSWYALLNRPSFAPPNWLFGPVWILLYTLMGISAYLVWEQGHKKKKVREALQVFGVQLVLNALWSILFFGLRMPLLAFFEITLLWGAIALTIVRFEEVSRKAAYLLVPYILWVSFAMLLNLGFWLVNL